jgi:predicted Zn-dependent peptidase
MLLSGYNSKLFVEMSEKRGIFYDTSGATERYLNIGTMYFSYELKDKDIYDAVALTVDILNSFKDANGTECECMKAGYVDNAYMLYDDVRELNFTFAYDNHIMNQAYSDIEERKRAYEDVAAEDIVRAAREIFRASNITLTVKGNKKRIDTQKLEEIIRRLG